MNKKIKINSVSQLIIHYVGNKAEGNGASLSEKIVSNSVGNDVVTLICNSFAFEEWFSFFFEPHLQLNPVYTFIDSIFTNSDSFVNQSQNLAKHLYDKSVHPKIKDGEFYVVYFKDCIVDGDTVDAVGLFKSENKDTFLKVLHQGGNFNIESQQGINIKKLDKGCLIFNKEKENGYVVAVVDNTNRGAEARYWVDDFLHVRQRKDEYYNTENVMKLAKNFVANELPNQFEISRAEQAELLNKTTQFFKEKDSFDMNDFANEVIAQPEVIDSFKRYKVNYQQERDIEIADSFDISDSAVKKQARVLKSVIKLDKNFHIYVHGSNQYIKKGFDPETGMHFYQLFFKEEQ